jgi:hypothetical protein
MTNQENIKENVYSKSVIYKIVPKDINLDYIYVGSTHRYNDRKSSHKSDYHNELSPRYKLEVYDYIRNNGGWYNFVINVIEEYPCESKRELEKREQYWKEIYGSNIGKRAYAEKNQYYLDHKEDILTKLRTDYDDNKKQQKRDYYLKNREKVIERQINYYNNVVKPKKALIEC